MEKREKERESDWACSVVHFANMALCFCDVEAYYLNMHSFIPPYKTLAEESVVLVFLRLLVIASHSSSFYYKRYNS